MSARLLAVSPFAILICLSVACGEPVDVDALVNEALEIEARRDQIAADRDAAERDLLATWDRVEKGPQMILNAHLDIVRGHEARGWTVEANKTREAAYSDFDSHPLVVEAVELAGRFERLDALWAEKNGELGDILSDIQDAGAIDQWRAASLAQ